MVEGRHAGRYLVAWSGLMSGPTAWAVSTQLNYAIVPWQCGNHAYPIPWIALLLAFAALAGSIVSLHAWRTATGDEGAVTLAAGVGAAAGFLFTAVILLQGLASLIFTGCER
jgi:hypothetical protein